MDWYDQNGETMEQGKWADPGNRTLQYVAASTPDTEAYNRILLIVHGTESPIDVRLPEEIEGATRFVSLCRAPTSARPTSKRSSRRVMCCRCPEPR